ncbi:hypothetical protein FEM03_23095 [Phragmitibacter flavus]|uniref:DAGKc domain-containing protein n=1 Tax=Phragmitibacter flavus TaxID=2576071 RepID=A0A5R8K7S7_9BACT|nr:acylglycerol kinase family protein [Phragmitibacter flavus]TLD68391.1 hypothetical protein FEM03_23095 [Phragmitibacter flavus]
MFNVWGYDSNFTKLPGPLCQSPDAWAVDSIIIDDHYSHIACQSGLVDLHNQRRRWLRIRIGSQIETECNMKAIVYHNPTAGDEDVSHKEMKDALHAVGWTVIRFCTDADDFRELLAREPADMLVVSGGDGTMRSAFRQLAGFSSTPILILARGTANNIALSLGIDLDWEKRLSKIEGYSPQPFHFGEVQYGQGQCRDFFFESVGVGVFADYLHLIENDPDRADEIAGSDEDKDFSKDYRAMAHLAERAGGIDLEVIIGEEHVINLDPALWMEVTNTQTMGPRVKFLAKDDPQERKDLAMVYASCSHREKIISWLEGQGQGDVRETGAMVKFGGTFFFSGQIKAFHIDDEVHEGEEGVPTTLLIRRFNKPLFVLR